MKKLDQNLNPAYIILGLPALIAICSLVYAALQF
jgi:hypothetical protein